MSDTQTTAEIVNGMAASLDAFKSAQAARVAALETKLNRPGVFHAAPGVEQTEVLQLKTADGRTLPVLSAKQNFSDINRADRDGFSLSQFCKDAIFGSRETRAASGPALVPTGLASTLIDQVRRQTVVVAAGASTIAIEGPTVLARLTQDPTVYQHTEGATDISESDIVAVPVTLNPKTLAVLIPLTAELVGDSPNLDQILNTALTAAFAAKLDALCIATLLADVNIPKSLATQDPALWAKLLEAVSASLQLNMQLPTAHIGAPADMMARASQTASTSGVWLGAPPILSGMRELQTTGLTAGTAFFGNFAEAFAIAMRQDMRIEVVRHAKPTSASHLLVAHMRADGVVLQPGKLFKQLKTIV